MFKVYLIAIWLNCVSSTLFGLCTKDSVLISAPETLLRGATVLIDTHKAIIPLHHDSNTLLGIEGDPSDCDAVIESVQRVNSFHRIQFGADLELHSLALHCARLIHSNLRENSRLSCQLLLGGVNPVTKSPELYWVDNVGALQRVKYGAHGQEMPLVLSLMDQLDREHCIEQVDMATGLALVRRCWLGIKRRAGRNIDHISVKFSQLERRGDCDIHLQGLQATEDTSS